MATERIVQATILRELRWICENTTQNVLTDASSTSECTSIRFACNISWDCCSEVNCFKTAANKVCSDANGLLLKRWPNACVIR